MSVVVTGAAGFLGRALVASLAADGVAVVAVDRRTPPDGPGVSPLRADLLDRDPAVTAALRSADAVFHLAGRPGVRDIGPAAEVARARDNVGATAAVLAAVPPGPPLVVISSSSVYGGATVRPSRETDVLRPLGGYARSKAAVEALCAGRPVTVLRPFTVAGEGQRPDMALARWIAAVRAGEPIRVLGSLERTRDVTDVRDVVRAARLAAERGVTGPLNVGTGRPRTLAELAAAVSRVLAAPVDQATGRRPEAGLAAPAELATGRRPDAGLAAPAELAVRPAARPVDVVVVPAGAVEPAATWADTTRLARTLGFVPVTDLDAVVARQVAAGAPERQPAAEPVLV